MYVMIERVKEAMGQGPDAPPELVLHIRTALATMKGAGVDIEDQKREDLIIGCAAIGANDLWQTDSGAVRFSPAFIMMISSLRR